MKSTSNYIDCVGRGGNEAACRTSLPPQLSGAMSCVERASTQAEMQNCIESLFGSDPANSPAGSGGVQPAFRPEMQPAMQQGRQQGQPPALNQPANAGGNHFQPALSGTGNNVLESQTMDNSAVDPGLARAMARISQPADDSGDANLPGAGSGAGNGLNLPDAGSDDSQAKKGAGGDSPALKLPDADQTASAGCAAPDRAQRVQDLTARVAQLQSTLQTIDSTIANGIPDASSGGTNLLIGGVMEGVATTVTRLSDTMCDVATKIAVPGEKVGVTAVCGSYKGVKDMLSDNGSGAKATAGAAELMATGDAAITPAVPDQLAPALNAGAKTMLAVDAAQNGKIGDALKEGVGALSEGAKFAGADSTTVDTLKAASYGASAGVKLADGDYLGAAADVAKAGVVVVGSAASAMVSGAVSAANDIKTGYQIAAKAGAAAENLDHVNRSAIAGMQANRDKVQGMLDSATAELNNLRLCDPVSVPILQP